VRERAKVTVAMLARMEDRLARAGQLMAGPPSVESASLIRGPLTTDGPSIIEVCIAGWGRLAVDGRSSGIVVFKPRRVAVVLSTYTTVEIRNPFGASKAVLRLASALPVLPPLNIPLMDDALIVLTSRIRVRSLVALIDGAESHVRVPHADVPRVDRAGSAINPVRTDRLSPIRRIRSSSGTP
jgi:hypothetical protein